MMMRVRMAAGLLAMLAGTAYAQPAPPDKGAAPMTTPNQGMPQGGPMMRMGPMGGPGHMPMGGPGMMGHDGPGEMMRMMHMPPPKAAVFMIESNGLRVRIKCADEESTKACVDAAGTLIDKLAAMRGNAPTPQ